MVSVHGELTANLRLSNSHLESHFAEIRSNIRLYSGFHYPATRRFINRELSGQKDQKIRVTKNHTQRIAKKIFNAVIKASPGTGIFPLNESEQGDIKSAELFGSVWTDIKDQNAYRGLVRNLAHDFVVCGEAWAMVFWDAQGGSFIDYSMEQDPETGEMIGEPTPRFKGKVILERLHAFNVLTDPEANSFDKARWVIVRTLYPTTDLKKRYKNDPDKLEYIDGNEDAFQVFDGLSGSYSDIKDHTQVNKIFYRPSITYPTGYYYYYTDSGILEEGELGISDEQGLQFPIVHAGYDEITTSARSYSIIKQIKPFQTEINRAGSAAIMESITLGHTTVMTPYGAKLSQNSIGNGMRQMTYTGSTPTIVAGVNGQQYIEYMNSQIDEMYIIANVTDHEREDNNPNNSNDAFASLFRSIKDKSKFAYYSEKFEDMLVDMTRAAIGSARAYYNDEMVIPIIGKDEQVNIDEFKTTSPLRHAVKVEARSEDYETLMGKSLMVTQLLQYAGSNLTQEQVGILARNLPFLNKEKIVEDLTRAYDTATNIILALDRGKEPVWNDNFDHAYIIERLASRMVKGDFEFMHPQIQQLYEQRKQRHQEVLVQQQQEAERAKAGFIPSGGGMVAVDYYVDSGNGVQKRARIPFEAVDWLITKLKEQGSDTQKIDNMDLGSQAELGKMMGQQNPPQEQGQPGMEDPYGYGNLAVQNQSPMYSQVPQGY